MRVLIALACYIYRYKDQTAESLFSSQYLPFGKTKNCIALICTALLFLMFPATSGSLASVSDDHKPNTTQPQTSMPSDWTFFTTDADNKTALYYSPRSVHTAGNNLELLVKWIHLQKQGPMYFNSQKIIKSALGEYNYTLSYGIGSFAFDCVSSTGTETKEIYYNSEGNTIFIYVPAPPVSSYFAPDTVYGSLLKIVCTKQPSPQPVTPSSAAPSNGNWSFIVEKNDIRWFENRPSVSLLTSNIVRIQLKLMPRRGGAFYKRTQEKIRAAGGRDDLYSYTTGVYDISCLNNSFTVTKETSYDTGGIRILSHKPGAWIHFAKDSAVGILKAKYCK